MTALVSRDWVPKDCEKFIQRIAGEISRADSAATANRLDELVARNRTIHERECFNLNPAANVMNPRPLID